MEDFTIPETNSPEIDETWQALMDTVAKTAKLQERLIDAMHALPLDPSTVKAHAAIHSMLPSVVCLLNLPLQVLNTPEASLSLLQETLTETQERLRVVQDAVLRTENLKQEWAAALMQRWGKETFLGKQ